MNPQRRKFVSTFIATGASALIFTATGIGIKNYYAKVVVKKMNILLTGLPEIFKGFKIIQISDLHIGQMMTASMLEEIVDKVNSLNPDLIAITGDLVDGSVYKLLKEVVSIKNLKAKKGIYFVTGNHEYYSGVESWIFEIEKMGIKVLNNESVKVIKKDDYFYLSGVTDHEAKKFGKEHAADFKKTFFGLQKGKKRILLAHQPIAVKEASKYGTDLVFAGHTHGGQIWPFTYLVYLQQPYLKGFYQYNETKLYVNQGTGCWGPPMRLGSYNEITEITLT
jgi:predicted MPP superfamily phosphohydrolase